MNELDTMYEFRDTLADSVVRDLVGPARNDVPTDAENILNEPPMTKYIAGVLYPSRADQSEDGEAIDPVLDNDVQDVKEEDRDDQADPPIALSNVRYPSAMGITFGVDGSVTSTITVTITAARYNQLEDDEDGRERWERVPVRHEMPVKLVMAARDETTPLGDGLEVFVREREPDASGASAVTIALINRLTLSGEEWQRDPYSFFQVEFDISAAGKPAFVDRSHLAKEGVDADARSYALLYRHSPSFATGHGCGADWEVASDDANGGATAVRSTVTPSHDLLLADNNPDVTSEFFGMRALAEGNRSEVIDGLRLFLVGYDTWITKTLDEAENLAAEHRSTAATHLGECRRAERRISAGIDLLETDDQVWMAFTLANRAMLMQRARMEWIKAGRHGKPNLDGDKHQWRAFQIGFILMTLGGIADPESDDRPIVDLLWFPTGGGKTEAYLGLIAFTVFLRRLRAIAGGGTGAGMTVIMRYTLRLLTLQQYQRASSLICAAEAIRRERNDLGDEEISICLWVGKAATPLTLADTRTVLQKLRAGGDLEENNPVQLRECPWCGIPLSHRNYWVTDHKPRLVIACRNEECEFEKGLPCYLVDEDVYNRRPTLMIATVDKFASLPWRDMVGPMFNVDDVEPPPELIIQDELHLISGPLGTMVGLYETAIHSLCSDGGIGPKVIASTATIRRAEQQIERLYASDGFQFPPPGIDARHSYFAVEIPKEKKGSRRYMGLMAPGTSHSTLMVRLYAAVLQRTAEMEADSAVKDPYWSLLGYFNSLRVLGAARMQAHDDVCERIKVLASASGNPVRLTPDKLGLIEMTSREKSSAIPRNLDRMSVTRDEPDCLDVILATNMISVGVDVDRLGLMAVMGQPQSSSEYIQATSRVGRRHPGLVFVLLNAARSRDRSHYEDFVSFHNSLYRQVDASSVTPFAARARDRALHAVFIGMLRARYPQFRNNNGAANVADLDRIAGIVIDQIVERVRIVEPNEVEGTKASLRQFITDWKRRAAETPNLSFANRQHPELALLADASRPEIAEQHDAHKTTWSMRGVDTESNLFLLRN